MPIIKQLHFKPFIHGIKNFGYEKLSSLFCRSSRLTAPSGKPVLAERLPAGMFFPTETIDFFNQHKF